jgi:hypothetical protein
LRNEKQVARGEGWKIREMAVVDAERGELIEAG